MPGDAGAKNVIAMGCLQLTGKMLDQMQDNITEMYPELKLAFLHCIIHETYRELT